MLPKNINSIFDHARGFKVYPRIILILVFLHCLSLYAIEGIAPENFNETNAGTSENPFLISQFGNLVWLSENNEFWGDSQESFYFEQTQDIDASESLSMNNGSGFQPIGYKEAISEEEVIQVPFTGNYNGNNFTITNLHSDISSTDLIQTGLFGYSYDAIFEGISLNNSSASTDYTLTSLFGIIENTSVTHCSANSRTEDGTFGGLAFAAINSSIEKSFSTSTISNSEGNSGGLVAVLSNSSIKNSYFIGSAVNCNMFGGIAGNVHNNSEIENCYARFSIEGNSNGGLVAFLRMGTSITNCFWDSETSQINNAVFYNVEGGDIVNSSGLTSEEMQTASPYQDAGWNFETIWSIDESTNWGLPFLQESIISSNDHFSDMIEVINISNYPNPFNPETFISFQIKKASNVRLDIFNLKGQLIKCLKNQKLPAGNHTVVWKGYNKDNQKMPSGIYLYKITSDYGNQIKKMILMK
jgi:hypothetical protein